ncbi:hypothetical protein EJ04DRAFT_259100 [Polyplosphaeria fusca]|uniref:Uncharacterized protein n=1 Tax=Polyplosphaeria fusca TaxID=682080 RepID=A0A9P4RAF9_9PLEO|nr:hypothetical protein EJ04DRAFT_259100 [Polyplosphaeria fusca]
MDPAHNRAFLLAKIITHIFPESRTPLPEPDVNMPPPSYEQVVDPNAPLPNMENPYDEEDSDSEVEELEAEAEAKRRAAAQADADNNDITITVNSAIHVRGHGNVLGAMSEERIQDILKELLRVEEGHRANVSLAATRRPRIHLTVTCPMTVTGDRNIVSPNLGDVAKFMSAHKERVARGGGSGANAAGAQGSSDTSTPEMVDAGELGEGSGGRGVKREAEEDVEVGSSTKRLSVPRA